MKAATILLIVLFAAIVFAVCMLLGKMGYSPFNQLYDAVLAALSGISLESFLADPMSAIATVGTAVGGIVGIAYIWSLYKQLSAAKEQLSSVTSSAQTQISSLTEEKNQLTETFNTQITSLKTEASTALEEAKTAKDALEAQTSKLTELTNQNSTLQTNYDTLLAEVEQLKQVPVIDKYLHLEKLADK